MITMDYLAGLALLVICAKSLSEVPSISKSLGAGINKSTVQFHPGNSLWQC
jgi:hypothetical protein